MVRIYTRTGDAGETGLFDGTRVSKSDPRVDVYGDVDAGASLHFARAICRRAVNLRAGVTESEW